VNYIDETPWYCLNTLAWLWVMASERVAFYMIHPRRSKEAFAALIDDWVGLLVSDGYGVYQRWVEARQTCVAHLIRTARGLAQRTNNRAERALRFGVLWRKRSLGTASDKGNRWVERILSLKETCRLHARATYVVLVDAITSFFSDQPPDLSWITAGVSTSAHP